MEYYKYNIEIKDRKIVSIEFNGARSDVFKYPVTSNKLPKLYVIKHLDKIAYVGITSQSLRDRFRYGFKAEGKNGYHGYAWKNLPKIELIVWCFQGKSFYFVEAIEAELVYLVRHNTGEWPSFQTEIHFHKTSMEERDVARNIFDSLSK